jgi:hypothetical protein
MNHRAFPVLRLRLTGWTVVAFLLLVGGPLTPLHLSAKENPGGLTNENRIAIIRGVSSEFAKARVALPRGEKGLALNEKGHYNENELKALLMKFGTAIDAGQDLQITRIEFRPKEILFEINGGGKKKSRWTDHVQVSAGPLGTPTTRPGQGITETGASLLLRFPGAVPNLTSDEVKQMLEHVLNFKPQSASENYVDTLPPEFKEAVAKHEARVGMDRNMVIAAMGRPDRKIREKNSEGIDQEQWIYGAPPGKVIFITFQGEKAISIKEY